MTKITNTYVLDKAKMSVLLLIMLFTCPLAFAQSEPETAKPLTDMEVVRKVAFLDIEGKYYEDVTMSFKSITPDYFISDKYKVKVKVVDKVSIRPRACFSPSYNKVKSQTKHVWLLTLL